MTKAVHSKDWEKPTKKKPGFHKNKRVSSDEKSGKNFESLPQEKKPFKHDKNLQFRKKFKPQKFKKQNTHEVFENSKIDKNSEEGSQNDKSHSGFKNKKKFIKKIDSVETSTMPVEGEIDAATKMSLKRKSDEFGDSPAEKKRKIHSMKFKDRKLMYKKNSQGEKFDVVKNLKMLWEELRREDCAPDKKEELSQKICGALKGHVKEYIFAHDTVRILECVIAQGSEEHRTLLFNELKDDILVLSKSKYAKFFVLKMLKYGSKKQKEAIMNAFNGIVIKLIKHAEASAVVEMAFNECANARQRFLMVQEFYGASYRHFKEEDIHCLAQLIEKKPETKAAVIKSTKEELLKLLEKSLVKHSLLHHVMLQFFMNCDPTSRSEVIQALRELIPEILHTKDGSRVAMHCVWHGTSLDRKIIIKHMKTFVKKIAMEEHGHMVLLALFDSVDDTLLLEKFIIKELQASLLEVAQNVHGKKVLVYLLNPRDPHFFHPDIINILKAGDNNENSKKNPDNRQHELKMVVSKPLTKLIVSKIAELYKNNAFCLLTVTILKHAIGDRREAFEAIARLVSEPYTSENKNVHILENAGSIFMLKQLILNDVIKETDNVTFSEVLVNTAPDDVMKTWFNCNRGAFLLVSLIETKLPAVVQRVKEELTGCKKKLEKLGTKGAEILLKKLREM